MGCCCMEGAHGDGGGNKENTLSHGKAPLDLVFKAVLADERATQEFLKFTQTEFSSENLEFYLVRQHVCTCGRPGPTPESCGCGRGRSWSLGVGVPACGPAVVAVASVVSLSCRPPRGLAGPGLVVWQLVWPGQRARALLLLLAAASCAWGRSPRRCEGSRSGARRTGTLCCTPRASGADLGGRSGPALAGVDQLRTWRAAPVLGVSSGLILASGCGSGPWSLARARLAQESTGEGCFRGALVAMEWVVKHALERGCGRRWELCESRVRLG